MSTRVDTGLASVALIVFFLSAILWPQAPTEFRGAVSDPASLSSLWSQDNRTLIASADNDSEDSDSDEKDAADGKEDEDDKLKELWDAAMLG